ncbi:16S rRNA (uracil(1498)-N(3))-methyltransferase [Candidatus Saccharibacteria bacterium]|nr:MAG: 16S rRNA (uracil(1498)-N(3))-methyltransferase [Candidatus Saccharibacteria bacterium]
MKQHRFFVKDTELGESIWVDDKNLLRQWLSVLRYQTGSQLVLFDGEREDRLYELTRIGNGAVQLKLVTELERRIPERDLYLLFSLLKKDKNDWVLQKCTELGVRHFVPILSSRTEKTGFNLERAAKIVVEAAEQCGRSDVPRVREPIHLETALKEFEGKIDLYFAEQSDHLLSTTSHLPSAVGVFIGPEGGWTEEEKELLAANCEKLNLGQFTLRAETASIVAVSSLTWYK